MDKWEFKRVLEEAGYTQAKLAKTLGMHEKTLSYKVNEKTAFSVPEVKRICEILNIEDPVKIFF